MVIGMEYWYSFQNRIRCFGDSEKHGNMVRKCIPKSRLGLLQTMSWFEVNQRIVHGAKLVIVDEFVFDIRRWIDVHPGGSRILDRVIGTDITNDFYGNIDGGRKELSEFYKLDKNKPQNKTTISKIGFTNYVDLLNSPGFNTGPLHRHSKFAADTLATMVVGILEDDKNVLPNIQKTSSMNTNLQIFKRYILVKREIVSGEDTKRPVIKFTFVVSNLNEDIPKFYPGDYVEIMSHTKGQVVV